jgi:anti-sigma regulatory factor (Ser/Thr protein kinase)
MDHVPGIPAVAASRPVPAAVCRGSRATLRGPRPGSGDRAQYVPGGERCLTWEHEYPGEAKELARLRRWLMSILPDCPAREDLLLVATELAGNAVRHTASGRGGAFGVRVTWEDGAVLVAVDDAGAPGEPHVVDEPLAEGRRGLLVVRELSARVGVSGDCRGRTVWAEVLWPDADAVAAGAAYLGSRFGVVAWYGRCTERWWALDGCELLCASSVPELAALLSAAGQAGLVGPAPPGGVGAGLPAGGAGQRRPGLPAGDQAA